MAKRHETGAEAMSRVRQMGQGNQDTSLSQMRSPVQRKAQGGSRPGNDQGRGRASRQRLGDAITIAQVRDVAQLVTLVGGFDRCHELLGVIRDVGGLPWMKDLLEALAAAQVKPKQSVNQPPLRVLPSEP